MATLSRPFTVKEIVGSSERDLRVECYCKPMEEGLVNFIQPTVRYFRNSSRIARQEYFRIVFYFPFSYNDLRQRSPPIAVFLRANMLCRALATRVIASTNMPRLKGTR
jgi:hypothetical protein